MKEVKSKKSFEELVDDAKTFISEEDRKQLKDAFRSLKSSGKRKAKQVRPIVPIQEWVNSEYYLGQDVYNIFPFWKDHTVKIFSSPVKINQVILSGAIGCLKTDTMYSTDKGFKTLPQLIELGNSVTILASHQKERGELSKQHILGIKPTKRIKFYNGVEIEGSFDHKVKVYRNSQIIWEEFRNLVEGDLVVHSHLEEPFGPDNLSGYEAYTFGYLIGLSGGVNYARGRLTIRLQNNLSNYNYLISVLEDLFSGGIYRVDGAKTTSIFNVSTEPFWLKEFKKSSDNRVIPTEFLTMNRDTIIMLLKGLFDSASKARVDTAAIELHLNNLQMLKTIKMFLSALGINTYNDGCSLTITKSKDVAIFSDKIGYSIKFKTAALEKVNSFLGKFEDNIQFRNMHDKQYFDSIDGYFNTVATITDSQAEVGDIEVPSVHHYNIGGLISHNTGKSTMGALLLIRKIYELSCYENISALFNLMGASRIAFAYLSVNKDQAMITGFAQIQEWIDSIPYFKEHFPRRTGMDSALVWEDERLLFLAGSVANHFIGSNLLGAILDEANFFDSSGSGDIGGRVASKVAKLYINVRNRATSRFLIRGVQESLSVLISSSQGSSSFTEQQINLAKDDPHTYIITPSQWEVKPWEFGDGRFLVYTGGDGFDAHIIETTADINTLLEHRGDKILSTEMDVLEAYTVIPPSLKERIIKVPLELKTAFSRSVTEGLRDFAGYSASITTKYFQSVSDYNKAIDENLVHPFTKEQITVSTTKHLTQDGYVPIKSYIRNGFKFKDLDKKRYMHIDLSKTGDSTGISMGYIKDWRKVYSRVEYYETIGGEENKVEETITVPEVTLDFMLRINPPNKPNEISFSKIRDFIIYLREEQKIVFGKITFDQAFSAQLMQELSDLGFNVAHLSVDRTSEAYDTLVDLIYESRIRMYEYAPFREELFNLVRVPNNKGGYKVDHPNNGSKDVADSLAGTIYNAINADAKKDMLESELTGMFISANKGRGQSDYEYEVTNLLDRLKKTLYS